ncbi:MAG: precorrin-6Y C5,15-methyltransferase (decarboxylating) subunit CbiT [Anaerovoracaceae bacterium]|nr:precorrin-6Y C5,15-methyltransferase (decarboxylating) subunit CbiT [Bacillota bacterium]MDY2670864.1 precorrin-6Y C5,15-methyltransferase (decarboxylating) subunit CbiT [Anaerovoracaceae bacterium]
MEKQVIIAGAGMGSVTDMTEGLLSAASRAELIIGPGRVVRSFGGEGRRIVSEYRAETIKDIVDEAEETRILVLVTGDQGFFSAAQRIRAALIEYSPSVMPGISSVSYMSACIGVPWSGAAIVSAHGRKLNIASVVRRNRVTYALTGGNVSALLGTLCEYGYGGLQVFVGERLSYADGKISKGTAEQLRRRRFDTLSIMAVINPGADERIRTGIKDSEFIRGQVPMTKRFVRSAVLSAMELRADSTVWDIGAGTGSVSVEAALSAYKGTVFAIEREEEGIDLIGKNAVKFHADNIVSVYGQAPEVLEGLPPADVCFIGGAGGKLEQILEAIKGKNVERTRVVITAVTVQTLAAASEALGKAGAEDISVSQIQVTETHRAGSHDLFRAQNPVFIIEGDITRGQVE